MELPVDVFFEIFSQLRCERTLLGSIAKVNREFRALALDSRVRESVRSNFIKEHGRTCGDCSAAMGMVDLCRIARDACIEGKLTCVQYFVEKFGADFGSVDGLSNTISHIAAHHSRLSILQYLYEKGADFNSSNLIGETPMHIAAQSADSATVLYLLSCGADFRSQSSAGWSPFLFAASRGDTGILEALVIAGVCLEEAGFDGETALSVATCFGRTDAVKYLVGAGANIDAQTNFGQTPLCSASSHGHLDIVRVLVASGADLEKQTNAGETPVIEAASNGYLGVVQFLADEGADLSKCGRDGSLTQTALRNKHWPVVEFLVNRERVPKTRRSRKENEDFLGRLRMEMETSDAGTQMEGSANGGGASSNGVCGINGGCRSPGGRSLENEMYGRTPEDPCVSVRGSVPMSESCTADSFVVRGGTGAADGAGEWGHVSVNPGSDMNATQGGQPLTKRRRRVRR
eukprot:Rmarinus@m.22976